MYMYGMALCAQIESFRLQCVLSPMIITPVVLGIRSSSGISELAITSLQWISLKSGGERASTLMHSNGSFRLLWAHFVPFLSKRWDKANKYSINQKKKPWENPPPEDSLASGVCNQYKQTVSTALSTHQCQA